MKQPEQQQQVDLINKHGNHFVHLYLYLYLYL